MAILINDNYSLAATKPFDARYLNISTPWTSVAAVNAAITTYRYSGLTVNINGVEYWYANGVGDGNLVIKDSGIANTGITTAINGLTKNGQTVNLGGALTGNTTITGAYNFGVNVTTINFTGSTVNIGGELKLKSSPATYVGDILTYDPSDGAISKTTLISLGGLTGATNGLTAGSNRVCLGGALIGHTSVTGAGTYDLCLGTDAYPFNQFVINTTNCFDLHGGNISMCGEVITISASGATFTDRTASVKQGIKYAGDYSTTFVDRSLPDKAYVDSVATGLHPHEAVLVATTVADGNIGRSGLTIVDGVSLVNGNRVLVKNQTLGWQNGIYVATGTTWQRSSDYNFSLPLGEIANGDLIPVLTGTSNESSIWILTTTGSTISSGTTLTFAQFSKLLGVSAGQGIAISTIGGKQNICTNLASNSGLEYLNSQLTIANEIAGNGLSWASGGTGVININAASCGSVDAIPVGYNTLDCLVVACSDIIAAIGAISAATNGLTATNKKVCLGGTLTEATTITVKSDTCSLTFTDSAGTKRGVVYGGDYSTGFGANSLISAKYVTGCTCILRNDITWISGNTVSIIAMNVYSGTTAPSQFANKSAVNNYTGTTNGRLNTIEGIYLTGATNGLGLSGKKVCLGGNLLNSTMLIGAYNFGINVTNVNLTGSTAINLTSPIIKLPTTPATGIVTDSVLVRASDGTVKILGTGSINIYTKTIVTDNTTLTTGSSYVILVNTGATVTITLPTAPLNGQTFKIKDVKNTALTYNIIIGRNGKLIDCASNDALINTDGGVLELMYDNVLGSWSILSFVN